MSVPTGNIAELLGQLQQAHLRSNDLLLLGHDRCPSQNAEVGRYATPTTPRPASASASAMTPTVRLSLNYCSKAIAIHAIPASANPSKANRRFRAFLLPRVGLRRLMITALALSATAIRHHGLTDKQSDRTRRRFKLAKVLRRPGGSSRPAGGRNP